MCYSISCWLVGLNSNLSFGVDLAELVPNLHAPNSYLLIRLKLNSSSVEFIQLNDKCDRCSPVETLDREIPSLIRLMRRAVGVGRLIYISFAFQSPISIHLISSHIIFNRLFELSELGSRVAEPDPRQPSSEFPYHLHMVSANLDIFACRTQWASKWERLRPAFASNLHGIDWCKPLISSPFEIKVVTSDQP